MRESHAKCVRLRSGGGRRELHCNLERTFQFRLAVLTQHGEQQLPFISRRSTRVKQGARDLRISLDSYRPPQAGQPQDRKVLSRQRHFFSGYAYCYEQF